MKVKIILPILFFTMLLFYPKNDTNLGPIALAENTPDSIPHASTNTNPFLEISGTISNYESGEGTITENNFWTGDKTTIGTIMQKTVKVNH
jgi:hypothetical protein